MCKTINSISEAHIQTRLFYHLSRKSHRWIAPNFNGFYTGEMDVVSVLRQSQFVNEFEIKISRADFKADAKKPKFEVFEKLQKSIFTETIEYPPIMSRSGKRVIYQPKPQVIKYTGPNYFYYVCPLDLISVDEIPDYAGLIYINPGNVFDIRSIKRAKRLHKTPISCALKHKIAESLMWRFWGNKNATEKVDYENK